MTIVYSKRTGNIKAIFSGDLQHINTAYGEESQDYMLIWDEISIEDDINVMQNSRQFKVNIETKALEMLPQINKYPIATT